MSEVTEKTFEDAPDGSGGPVIRGVRVGQHRRISRPNTAPAYYQGRPADLLITALSPRRKRTASGGPVRAVAA